MNSHRDANLVEWSSLAAMIALMTFAQLLFKQAGLHANSHPEWYLALALNPWLAIGLAASAAGMGCWLLALRRLALSTAYPWTAFTYILTPIGATALFGEVITSRYVVGMALIVTGVVVATGGAKPR